MRHRLILYVSGWLAHFSNSDIILKICNILVKKWSWFKKDVHVIVQKAYLTNNNSPDSEIIKEKVQELLKKVNNHS